MVEIASSLTCSCVGDASFTLDSRGVLRALQPTVNFTVTLGES